MRQFGVAAKLLRDTVRNINSSSISSLDAVRLRVATCDARPAAVTFYLRSGFRLIEKRPLWKWGNFIHGIVELVYVREV